MRVAVKSVADGIAAALDATGEFAVTYALPSPHTEAQSATVLPTGGRPEVPCTAALRFDVVLTADPSDVAEAFAWLMDRVSSVTDALAADPTCGGTCTGVAVESWGSVEMVSIGGGADALSLRVTLTETNPRG